MENTKENDQENKEVTIVNEVHDANIIEVVPEQETPTISIEEKKQEEPIIATENIVFESEKVSDEMLSAHQDKNPEIKDHTAEQINFKSDAQTVKEKDENTVGVDISMFITPRLLIVIYDKIWPNIIVYVATNFLKLEVDKSINLDEGEIELLEPIVAEMIKGINMKLNPLTAFLLCSNFFYITKLMEPKNKNQSITETKKISKKKRGRPRKVTISNGLL